MRPLTAMAIGALAGLTLVAGAVLSGLSARPGAAMRQVQFMQIDLALGPAERIAGPDGEIFVWRYGPEIGPRVVLVHGFGDAASGWVPLALSLGKTHRVILLDLPGHGRSAPRGPLLTMAQVQAGLTTVLDQVDAPFTLVGNSLGGWVSTRHALAHPDRIQRLVLVNSAGLPRRIARDKLLPTTVEGIRAKNEAILGEHAPDLPVFALRALVQLHAEPRLHSLYNDLNAERPYVDGQLKDLGVPTTLVWGTPDPFFPVQGSLDRWQAALPDAPTVLLEGCGHAPQYSCQQPLAQAIIGDADPSQMRHRSR